MNLTATIIGGLAVGIFLGYEFSRTLAPYQPYHFIGLKVVGYAASE